MDNRLNIAFYWHMHQPLYKDPFSSEYVLPWVLLHGTKDYYDMAAILDDFPQIHQTFNLVPSLIDQLNDYASGTAKDYLLEVTKKKPDTLTFDEKLFIIDRFFQANWHCMIKPMDRYWELLLKRGFSGSPEDLVSAVRYFKDQDFLDLQVLFNLAWIDPETARRDSLLTALREKGKGFSEADKANLLKKQKEIVKRIIPKYKELMEAGTIEITTSPYFHPIMPLLCDTESAREAEPHITLPGKRYQHPEDAHAQLKMGIELHTETFGSPPKGLWPSEGSVSMDTLALIAKTGVEWIATDEDILVHSLGRGLSRDQYGNSRDSFIYRPYSVPVNGSGIDMVFRDHTLSDLIGFDYAKWDPEMAADNMITRLTHIADMVDNPEEHIVSIILDGENAWETYQNDGRDFLVSLYTKLSDNKRLKCVNIGEFLSQKDSRDKLHRVFSGSWISHNFRVWIGHQEDNLAWDLLNDAREALSEAEAKLNGGETPAHIEEARSALYAAQGSDWFWWYGDIHSSENDEVFDSLFRRYIKKIYTALGLTPPVSLESPIIGEERGVVPDNRPTRFIEPVIDGEITSYFEWYSAGLIKRSGSGGAMHTSNDWEGLLDGISYGFNIEKLFFRVDYLDHLKPYMDKWTFTLNVTHPAVLKIEVDIEGTVSTATPYERVKKDTDGHWKKAEGVSLEIASGGVVELAVPFEAIGADIGNEVCFFFEINSGERGFERWPVKGHLILDRPSENFEKEDWSV